MADDKKGQRGFLQERLVSGVPGGTRLSSANRAASRLSNRSAERAGWLRVCFQDDQRDSRAKTRPPLQFVLGEKLGD